MTTVEIMNFLKQAGHNFTKQSIVSSERRVFKTIKFKVKLKIYLNIRMLVCMVTDNVIRVQWGPFRNKSKFYKIR
jgi:hypothetical protein